MENFVLKFQSECFQTEKVPLRLLEKYRLAGVVYGRMAVISTEDDATFL